MEDLFEALVGMALSSELEELEKFNTFLDNLQEEDYGPRGEFARAIQENISYRLEELRREA